MLPYPVVPTLKEHFEQVFLNPNDRALSAPELSKLAHDAEVVLCTILDRIDESFLESAPHLKCVVTFSVGTDHLDLAALKKRGIAVTHTPSVLTDATADLTWALILACARFVKVGVKLMEENKFTGISTTQMLGKELRGCQLGIVGMGRIGKAVALRAAGFGMTVEAITRQQGSLENLLQTSDVVSLHCPLTPETRHLIGHRELFMMKEDAILVNTARGPIVNESALMHHLKANPTFQAGLDVFEEEPKVTPGLAQLPNVVALPHLGSATSRARGHMAEVCVQEAIRFAKREPLRYEVGKG